MTTASPLREKHLVESLRSQAQPLVASLDLQHSPDIWWPIVSQTDIMNEKLGLNPTDNAFRATTYGGSEMSVETTAAGMTMAYEEFPFEWQAPHFLQVERIFHKGLLRYLRFGIYLEVSATGTRLRIEMHYVPAIAGPVVKGVLQLNLKQMVKLIRACEQKLGRGVQGIQVYFEDDLKFQPQIDKLHQDWLDLAPYSEVPQALATYLLTAPDRFAARIRPFEVASLYDLLPLETLRFCLLASKAGYLHIRWDMRCPSCKGPKENRSDLQGVSSHAFCPSCAVDYAVGFDQNLELTFFPDAKVRKVRESHFCAGSPANSPHLPVQANFWPLETRLLNLELEPGVYVFRSLSVGGELNCEVTSEGPDSLTIELGAHFSSSPVQVSPRFQLKVVNPRAHFQTLQLENLDWKSHLCSGALVSSLPEFRDFFSDQVPAENISLRVARQTFLMAHLSQGDQPLQDPAFMKLISQALRQHDGTQLSCEAQTVLAVFQDPLDALKAALMLSQQLVVVNHFVSPEHPLALRISFHEGPCEVSNHLGALVYRGEALEQVKYLQGLAQPGSILVSEAIFADPDLKWLLLQQQARIQRLYEPEGQASGLQPYQIVPASAKGGL